MAGRSRRRGDFMFCDLCGTLHSQTSPKLVECPLCKFQKGIQGLRNAEEMRRDLGISSYDDGHMEIKIIKNCEKCGHTKLTFSARQMRSADEGQTIFFCSHKFTENRVQLWTQRMAANSYYLDNDYYIFPTFWSRTCQLLSA